MRADGRSVQYRPMVLPAILLPLMWGCSHFLALYFQGAALEFVTCSMFAYTATTSAVVLLLTGHCILLQYMFHSVGSMYQRIVFPLVLYAGVAACFLWPTDGLNLFSRLHDHAFTKSQDLLLIVVFRYMLLTIVAPLLAMWLLFPFNGRTTWRRFSPAESSSEAELNARLRLHTSVLSRLLLPIIFSMLIVFVPGTYLQSVVVGSDEFAEFAWRFLLLFGFVAVPLWLASRIKYSPMAIVFLLTLYIASCSAVILGGLLEHKWHLFAPFSAAVAIPAVTMIVVSAVMAGTRQLPRRMRSMTLRQGRDALDEADPKTSERNSKTAMTISIVSFAFGFVAIAVLQYANQQEFIFTRVTKKPVSYQLQAAIDRLRSFSLAHRNQWEQRPDLQLEAICHHNETDSKILLPVELAMEPWWQKEERVFRSKGFEIVSLPLPAEFSPPDSCLIQGNVLHIWDVDKMSIPESISQCDELQIHQLKIDWNAARVLRQLASKLDCGRMELNDCHIQTLAISLFLLPECFYYINDCRLPKRFANLIHPRLFIYASSRQADQELLYECMINGVAIFVSEELLQDMSSRPFTAVNERGDWYQLQLGPARLKDCIEPLRANLDWEFLTTDDQGQLLFLDQSQFPDDASTTLPPFQSLQSLTCRLDDWRRNMAEWKRARKMPVKLRRLTLLPQLNEAGSSRRTTAEDLDGLEFHSQLAVLDLTHIETSREDLNWKSWFGESKLEEIRVHYDNVPESFIVSLAESQVASIKVVCSEDWYDLVQQQLELVPVEVIHEGQVELEDAESQ